MMPGIKPAMIGMAEFTKGPDFNHCRFSGLQGDCFMRAR
jgi:hypothetical protein